MTDCLLALRIRAASLFSIAAFGERALQSFAARSSRFPTAVAAARSIFKSGADLGKIESRNDPGREIWATDDSNEIIFKPLCILNVN